MVNGETPWTGGGLRIARAVIDAVEADALRGYAADEEACGYLTGPAADGLLCDGHVRMENVANKLHAMDPETYFRTARMYFAFNEAKFDRAVREGAKAGRPVKVIYHSHLDAGAYFSPTDAAVMSLGEPPAEEGGAWKTGPGPAWPLAFLVTSVGKAGVQDHRLFIWDGEAKAFTETPYTITD
jgi:[CysO sulfur-carrier protein]-S-L-cysteine hydrolase